MMRLKDKVAVVTGANSGIGLAIAKYYVQEGAKVVLAARREDKLKQAQQSIGGDTAICVCDVADLDAIDRLVQLTKETYGEVDIVVANAGVTNFSPLEEVNPESFDHLMSINLRGLYFTVQRFQPLLRSGASIILISSIASKIGVPNHALYGASKGAVTQLTRNFASDLVDKNIRVNGILPGPIETPIFDQARSQDPQVIDKIKEIVPMKRFGQPEEIASLATYLASDESSFMTAQNIVVDGGIVDLRQF